MPLIALKLKFKSFLKSTNTLSIRTIEYFRLNCKRTINPEDCRVHFEIPLIFCTWNYISYWILLHLILTKLLLPCPQGWKCTAKSYPSNTLSTQGELEENQPCLSPQGAQWGPSIAPHLQQKTGWINLQDIEKEAFVFHVSETRGFSVLNNEPSLELALC